MAAIHTLALALGPKFVHLPTRRKGRHPAAPSALRIVEATLRYAPRHRALSSRCERANDNSLMAHGVHAKEEPLHETSRGPSCVWRA
jgi:hypothetical protein